MPADYYTRFPELLSETMTPLQLEVQREIESGPRKAVIGPFIPLLHAPELARRIQRVGEYLRFESSLPKDVLECAIITVAKRWESAFEWSIHSGLALKAGVPADVVEAIKAGTPVEGEGRYPTVISFCRRVLAAGDAGGVLFGRVQDAHGLQGVLELLTVCGYYSTLAMYLNTAKISE